MNMDGDNEWKKLTGTPSLEAMFFYSGSRNKQPGSISGTNQDRLKAEGLSRHWEDLLGKRRKPSAWQWHSNQATVRLHQESEPSCHRNQQNYCKGVNRHDSAVCGKSCHSQFKKHYTILRRIKVQDVLQLKKVHSHSSFNYGRKVFKAFKVAGLAPA